MQLMTLGDKGHTNHSRLFICVLIEQRSLCPFAYVDNNLQSAGCATTTAAAIVIYSDACCWCCCRCCCFEVDSVLLLGLAVVVIVQKIEASGRYDMEGVM